MPTAIDSAMANLAKGLLSVGVPVTYGRTGETSLPITGVVDEMEYEVATTDGGIHSFVSIDFVIYRNDLNFGAGVVDPARGDTITYTDHANKVRVCKVMWPGDSRPFEYDPLGHKLIVHTKET